MVKSRDNPSNEGLCKMKVFLSLLMVSVICVEFATSCTKPDDPKLLDGQAHTLQCYTCREETPTEKCVAIENCTETENMCKTTMYSLEEVYPFTGVSTVTKMCSSVCVPSDVDGIGMTRPVFCCYSDLCNTDGATSLRTSFMPVGMLASSLCAFFWTRP